MSSYLPFILRLAYSLVAFDIPSIINAVAS